MAKDFIHLHVHSHYSINKGLGCIRNLVNKAINDATANDLKVAWSNEAFELWYLLHFIFLDTAITRKAYIE